MLIDPWLIPSGYDDSTKLLISEDPQAVNLRVSGYRANLLLAPADQMSYFLFKLSIILRIPMVLRIIFSFV